MVETKTTARMQIGGLAYRYGWKRDSIAPQREWKLTKGGTTIALSFTPAGVVTYAMRTETAGRSNPLATPSPRKGKAATVIAWITGSKTEGE